MLMVKYESNQRIFHRSSRPTLEVHFKALEFMDMVLIGLLVRLGDIQRRRRRDT